MLAKAKLVEVRWTGDPPQSEVVPGGKEVLVQFNPESLKINFANEDNSRGQSSPGQTTGSGTSKLAVELVFDTTTTGVEILRTSLISSRRRATATTGRYSRGWVSSGAASSFAVSSIRWMKLSITFPRNGFLFAPTFR